MSKELNVKIEKNIVDGGHISIRAFCGKKEGFVFFGKSGIITVAHLNNHNLRGGGRSFTNIFDAINAYRSPEMKAIIRAAVAA